MKGFLKLYRIEQKMFLRTGDVLLFNLIMPVVILVLIALIAGNKTAGEEMSYLQSAFVSLISVGICCSAFMSIPIAMVEYREKKILKQFYCSPCSPVWLLGADVLSAGIVAMLSAVIVTLTAIVGFGYRMQGNIFVFVGAWLFTMLSMFSIGLLIASLCPNVRVMNVVTSLVYFPMLLLSGATIPYEIFPTSLQSVADFMPLAIGIRWMKDISMGKEAFAGVNVIVLLLILIICTIISVKTFRWE